MSLCLLFGSPAGRRRPVGRRRDRSS